MLRRLLQRVFHPIVERLTQISWRKNLKYIILLGFVEFLIVLLIPTVLLRYGVDPVMRGMWTPLATKLSDARTEVSFLDDYDPKEGSVTAKASRDPDGKFLLDPGLHEFYLQSYCLQAGKWEPGKGSGYLYAPLKGSRASIVRNILRRSVKHPEIPQEHIQVLIWAIEGGHMTVEDLKSMSPEMRGEALKLLSPADIFELNGGLVGLIPEQTRQRLIMEVIEKLPKGLREAWEAGEKVRQTMKEAKTTYDELERNLVLSGKTPWGKGSRKVPQGRWSYHPDGYFIRYFPSSYTETRVQVSVPENFTIKRDKLGRIIRIADRYGNRIEAEYDDSVEPQVVSGDGNVRAYAFRSVQLVRRVVIPPDIVFNQEAKFEDRGWTLVGVPSGGEAESSSSQFTGLKERYVQANKHKEELEKLDEQFSPEGDMKNIINLGHFKVALKKVVSGSQDDEGKWVADHVNLVSKAWQSEVSKRESSGEEKQAFLDPVSAYAEGKVKFDPSSGAATPGNTSRQRLGLSGRLSQKESACDKVQAGLDWAKQVKQALEDTAANWSGKGDSRRFDEAMKERLGELTEGEQGHSPMGTHPTDCRIAPGDITSAYHWDWKMYGRMSEKEFEDYIREKYFGDEPDIIWDAAHTHEQVHIDSCRNMTEDSGEDAYKDWMNDPENFSNNEIAAYEEQIEMLERWLNQNCK